MANVLAILNICSSFAALYLYVGVYGTLVFWWMRVYRAHAEIDKSTFATQSDKLHLIAIIWLVFNLISAVIIYRKKYAAQVISAAAITVAGVGLLATLFLAF